LYQKTTIKFFNKKDTTTLKIFNMKLQNLFIATALLFATTVINAQAKKDSHTVTIGIPQVALLDIESTTGTAITLDATAPTEAGEKVEFTQEDSTDSTLWINYSSIVSGKATREVTVQITGGDIPKGIELSVEAQQYAGDGQGTMGRAISTAIVLDDKKAATIIEGVGSAYTGNGAGSGHNLTYKIAQTGSYSDLEIADSSLTIMYTLTDM